MKLVGQIVLAIVIASVLLGCVLPMILTMGITEESVGMLAPWVLGIGAILVVVKIIQDRKPKE